MIKNCENCGVEFNASKNCRKYCSLECRIVPAGQSLAGKTFGWLTVTEEIARIYKKNKPKRQFRCLCKCGNEVIKTYDGVKNKGYKTPSCGCFMSWHATNRIKHGMSKTKIYRVWAALKVRCYKKHDPSYKRYGAKGVMVCKRWQKFENFYEDMGASYKEGLTLDRYPNQRGNYELSNCRWATYKQQNRNLSSNKKITVRGFTACVSEFSEVSGAKKGRIYFRLKNGWSDEDAVLGRKAENKESNFEKIKLFYEGSGR